MWTRLPKLEAECLGGAGVHTHTAPWVLLACVCCLIALNCGTVFSTQTSVSVAAPSTDPVGVGNERGP